MIFFLRPARLVFALVTFISLLFFNPAARAAPLQVSPISVDLTAPAQTATVTLRSDGDRPANVQVRVFSWSQVNGEDQLTPSRNVIASPPVATLQPGTTYTIRVARIAPPLKSGEETYRLLIDQLPEVNLRRPAASVNMLLRYSIPVFFTERGAGADLKWNISRSGKTLIAEATNTGNRHAKLAGLTVESKAGKVSFGEGLNGYVLPGMTRRWVAAAGAVQPGASVTVTAKGDDYAVNQTLVVQP